MGRYLGTIPNRLSCPLLDERSQFCFQLLKFAYMGLMHILPQIAVLPVPLHVKNVKTTETEETVETIVFAKNMVSAVSSVSMF